MKIHTTSGAGTRIASFLRLFISAISKVIGTRMDNNGTLIHSYKEIYWLAIAKTVGNRKESGDR